MGKTITPLIHTGFYQLVAQKETHFSGKFFKNRFLVQPYGLLNIIVPYFSFLRLIVFAVEFSRVDIILPTKVGFVDQYELILLSSEV